MAYGVTHTISPNRTHAGLVAAETPREQKYRKLHELAGVEVVMIELPCVVDRQAAECIRTQVTIPMSVASTCPEGPWYEGGGGLPHTKRSSTEKIATSHAATGNRTRWNGGGGGGIGR